MQNSGNATSVREFNLQLVRRSLRGARSATCAQLARDTGLSVPSAAEMLRILVSSGEASEGDLVPSSGGRPARLYRFEARRRLALAAFGRELDGRDALCLRVADLQGERVDAEDLPLERRDLGEFEAAVDRMRARWPALGALAFGLPGAESRGRLAVLDYPALEGLPFAAHFRERCGLPVLVENDANAAALGRAARDGFRGSLAYLYFPRKYPPGAGLLVDGRLVRGAAGYAGEISRLPLGIAWGSPSLFDSAEGIRSAVGKAALAASALLNPERLVLQGEFLDASHLEAIRGICVQGLPPGGEPELSLSDDFSADLEAGLTALALEALEPASPFAAL